MLPGDVVRRLAAAGCVSPEAEAARLLASDPDPLRLQELIERRAAGEPLAWLLGWTEFCGMPVVVHPGVYVPRWHTEVLARRAAARLPSGGVAVDLCTGSGAVAAWLQATVPGSTVVATDVDPAAVACARVNGVDAFEGHLDDPLPPALRGAVDVMTAVVPYVPTAMLPLLARDVLAFEPGQALDGGEDGLRLVVDVVRRSVGWLRPGGWLLLELGGGQAAPTASALDGAGFNEIALLRDEEGDERGIEARR